MFDFALGPEQTQMRSSVREFVQNAIIPIAAECDRKSESPVDIYQQFFQDGWMARFLPSDGEGPPDLLVNASIVTEELAYGCAAIASAIMMPIFFSRLALLYLPEAEAERFREELEEKPFLTAFAASEHDAGSDLLALRTTAERGSTHYTINGRKAFSSNVRHARYVIVLARSGSDGDRSARAFSWFLVPTESSGLTIGERWNTLGLRSLDVAPVDLDQVQVPESLRLGEEGDGLSLMEKNISMSRTAIAAVAVGIARRARDAVLEYAKSRRLYGDKVYKLQDFRFQMVNMEMDIAAARGLVWMSGLKHDRGLDHTKEASIAKLFAGEMAMRVTEAASRMMGSLGYTDTMIVEKLLRDARHVAIVEGPDPVQRETIFAQMLRRGVY